MHFHGLDLNLLVALDSLLQERNVTSAGERLHITQSAASAALARLREYFGDELLVQMGGTHGGKRMVPTAMGEALIEPVSAILLQINSTICALPQFDPMVSTRRFRIMTSEYVQIALLTKVMREMEKLAPRMEIEVVQHDARFADEAIHRAEVDFVIGPSDALNEQQPQEVLFNDDFVCIVSLDNLQAGDSLSLAQYLRSGHATAVFNRGRTTAVDVPLMKLLSARRIEVTTADFGAIVLYVAGTQRIGTVPRRLAVHFSQFWPVRLLELPVALPSFDVAVQWNQLFDRDPAKVWLRELMRRQAHSC